MFSGITYAIENGSDIVVKDPGSFLDSTGRLNIIGVIDNNGDYPIGGVVGLNLTDKSVSRFPANSGANDIVAALLALLTLSLLLLSPLSQG